MAMNGNTRGMRDTRDARQAVVNLEGTVSEVVYMNPETSFAVIEVDTGEELLPVVGELYGVSEGEELRLTGSYTSHPKFGRQFKALAFERRMPATAAAIKKFLSSGAVKGIGAVLASRIVDTFGDDTMARRPAALPSGSARSPAGKPRPSTGYWKSISVRQRT